MTDQEYSQQRTHLLEAAVRGLMRMVSDSQPLLACHINQMGMEWDAALDRLDSAKAAASPHALDDDKKGGA